MRTALFLCLQEAGSCGIMLKNENGDQSMGHASAAAIWEKKLNISTCAAAYEKDDANHNRYEPTPYAVLERLAESGWLENGDILVDYGCGKGRVGFFLNYALGIRAVGVEYNPGIHCAAALNAASYIRSANGSVSFVCESAENYEINNADCFYFFNPFSAKILKTVIGKIIASYFEKPRRMRLFFYYPTDEYLDCLMSEEALEVEGEIDCRDLFHNDDPRERILIFKIAYEI